MFDRLPLRRPVGGPPGLPGGQADHRVHARVYKRVERGTHNQGGEAADDGPFEPSGLVPELGEDHAREREVSHFFLAVVAVDVTDERVRVGVLTGEFL